MHIFLTGNVQIGKSTVIDKVLAQFNGKIGGFRTAFGTDRNEADRWLYMWDAADAPKLDETHGVVRFIARSPEVFLSRFNEIGGNAIRQAQKENAALILMDECGRFEGDAAEFQSELFAALDGKIPVLGVIRYNAKGWLDKIRSHPNVTVLTVTEENRDELPAQILTMLNNMTD